MQLVKSSELRKSISSYLTEVAQKAEDIGIVHNNEVVAKLTLTEPTRAVKAVELGVEAARKDWSKLIDSITALDAYFEFKNKKTDAVVFLIRYESYENQFSKRWREQLRGFNEEKNESNASTEITLEDLDELEDELKNHIENLEKSINSSTNQLLLVRKRRLLKMFKNIKM